jgi:sec-independent protein translocase protein TatA
MDFLGMGAGEILLILVVAFLLWGPSRVVEIARTLGKTVHAFRKAASDFTEQVNREIEEQKTHESPQKRSTDESPRSS